MDINSVSKTRNKIKRNNESPEMLIKTSPGAHLKPAITNLHLQFLAWLAELFYFVPFKKSPLNACTLPHTFLTLSSDKSTSKIPKKKTKNLASKRSKIFLKGSSFPHNEQYLMISSIKNQKKRF